MNKDDMIKYKNKINELKERFENYMKFGVEYNFIGKEYLEDYKKDMAQKSVSELSKELKELNDAKSIDFNAEVTYEKDKDLKDRISNLENDIKEIKSDSEINKICKKMDYREEEDYRNQQNKLEEDFENGLNDVEDLLEDAEALQKDEKINDEKIEIVEDMLKNKDVKIDDDDE